ncbi:universal stress protein [Dyella silvae]|uniref:universal stress protein n=1 Tax=Dyella silvae TaxID=2994424 RepID=UPI002263F22C|nr:universal stress protein [Dyella silvae]
MNASSAVISPPAGAPTDVLALVTACSPWSPAAHVAVALAADFGARVTGCYVDPALRVQHGGESEPSVLALLMDLPHENSREREAFHELARHAGVSHALWTATRTGIAPTLRQLGAWHDLAVIEREIACEGDSFGILSEALLTCRTTCLILPPSGHVRSRFTRLAIAWNGSIESARAIHAALPFARLAEEVWLFDGETPAYEDDQERAPHIDPLTYLAHHGIHARPRRIHTTPHDAGAALLREIAELKADLLVMGAYGRSRVRERVLGGATRHVLQHAGVPVLMRH